MRLTQNFLKSHRFLGKQLSLTLCLMAFTLVSLFSSAASTWAASHLLLHEAPRENRQMLKQKLQDRRAKRLRAACLNPALTEEENVREGDSLTLNLFDDTRFEAIVDKIRRNRMGARTVRGRIQGERYANAIIVSANDQTCAYINMPEKGKFYKVLQDRSTNAWRVLDIDHEDLEYRLPTFKTIPDSALANADDISAEAAYRMAVSAEPAIIDVMMIYTPEARRWAANQGGIDNIVAASMANTQLVADNSEVGVHFRLVHSAEVDYNEAGSSSSDLTRLTRPSDGYLDQVHEWRDAHGADLVVFLTDATDVGGVGWQLTETRGIPQYAFCLVSVRQAATSYSVAHEMGHNMGLHHHADQTFQPGPGIFSYSAGWRWSGSDGNLYNSVMAYEYGAYYENRKSSRTAPYYSNPRIYHLGAATGHDQRADNARTLQETKAVIAGYRNSETIVLETGIQSPTGYDEYDPDTWRTLEPGKTEAFYANDIERTYEWALLNWNNEVVIEQQTGDGSFNVDTEELLSTYGAGIYTVCLTEIAPGSGYDEMKVRLPMQFIPDGGSYYDNHGTETFTVRGGPDGRVYYFELLDMNNQPVTEQNCGVLGETLSTSENTFSPTEGIPSEISFRVHVTLDPSAGSAEVQRLIDAGLDEIWSDEFTVSPSTPIGGCNGYYWTPPWRDSSRW